MSAADAAGGPDIGREIARAWPNGSDRAKGLRTDDEAAAILSVSCNAGGRFKIWGHLWGQLNTFKEGYSCDISHL